MICTLLLRRHTLKDQLYFERAKVGKMNEIFYQNVYRKVNLYNEPITRNFQGFKLKAINITILQGVTIFLAEN